MPRFFIKDVRVAREPIPDIEALIEQAVTAVKGLPSRRIIGKKGGILECVIRIENVKKLKKAKDELERLRDKKYAPWPKLSRTLQNIHNNR